MCLSSDSQPATHHYSSFSSHPEVIHSPAVVASNGRPAEVTTMVNMPVQVATFDMSPTEELTYRGEGNSSLVVALKSKRKVIRLLKSDAKKRKNDEDVRSLLLQHIDFNVHILPQALPTVFYSPPQLISLDPAQLERIRNLVKDKRPSFRLDKTITESDSTLLMSDYCCIPKCIASVVSSSGKTLSIEIKPKQGFLPSFNLFSSDTELGIKSEICRFGLSQFYKLQKQSISGISSYCPLDLFSGCRNRALHAIFSLIRSPQNNFRVFSDAQLIYGDQYYGKSGNVEYLQQELAKFFSLDHDYTYSNGHNGYGNGYQLKDGSQLKECTKLNQIKYTNGQQKTSLPGDELLILSSLLVDSLYDNTISQLITDQQPKEGQILKEFERCKLRRSNEPCFFITFMEMFNVDGGKVSDINNNKINGERANDNHNVNRTTAADSNNNIPDGIAQQENINETTCSFHQLQSPHCCSDPNYSCETELPRGCVLDWILRAQKLDSLDTSLAVQLYDKLCDRYRDLRHSYSAMDNSFADSMYCEFIEEFIGNCLTDLEKLWRFLISLTAKDCSIMMAIQRAEPSMAHLTASFVHQGTTCATLVEDRHTGLAYVVSISITDLDFKQAYKIRRSFYNDQRMIKAFWRALRAEPATFPVELVKSKLLESCD